MNLLVFRKSTSDGSVIPITGVYDTILSGGTLVYDTATGLLPADITLDGGEFVTKTTSSFPEEVIPGQIVDTVDIGVYHNSGSDISMIRFQHYTVTNASTRVYDIGQTASSCLVLVDDVLVSNYTTDLTAKTITFNSNQTLGDKITIVSTSNKTLLDVGSFIADGNNSFVTTVDADTTYTVFATDDGNIREVTTFETYAKAPKIGFKFGSAPNESSVIEYFIIEGKISIANIVNNESVVYEGTSSIPLANRIGAIQTVSPCSAIETQNTVLTPASYYYYPVSGTSRTYVLTDPLMTALTISKSNIKVYVDTLLLSDTQYTWTQTTKTLKIKSGVARTGDVVVLEVIKSAEYQLARGGHGSTTLELLGSRVYQNNDIINITTLQLFRVEFPESENLIMTNAMEQNDIVDQYRYTDVITDSLTITRPPLRNTLIWVRKNNVLLEWSTDYTIDLTRTHIILSTPTVDNDVIKITSFTNGVAETQFGFKIFKDMLNHTRYIRINDLGVTTLDKPLAFYEDSIEVVDGSVLAIPSIPLRKPGIILLNGERIEYYVKTGNTLAQLRRGTLGTSISPLQPKGQIVRNISDVETIPYSDSSYKVTATGDGTTRFFGGLETIPVLKPLSQSWYRSTIPNDYGQAEDIEVYVAGKRLRKVPITIENIDGSMTTLEAEFSVNGISKAVRMTNIPANGTSIEIYQKQGQLWSPTGTRLSESTSEQALFILEKTGRYYADKYVEPVVLEGYIEAGELGVLTDENGVPIEVD